MLELFTSVADAFISYAIDKLDPTERIKSWLRLDPARLAFKKALALAYSAFARQYPEYTSSLFDQSFLSKNALPELSKLLTRNQHPDPALLAQAWGRSLGAGADFAQAATKPAAYFLERFEAELKAEPALQSIFDSRAVESLPKLEAEIQKLSTDLQRGLDEALKAAQNYQQVTIHIGGDVKGEGIVIGNNNQLTINKYNYSTHYYYSGDFIALNEYYIPPDGVFQRVRVDEFVGRDWLTAKVDAFLNDPNRKSGAFLLIGDAGVGKTSFMAHLVKERRYLHLFAGQVPGQAMLQRAMQSLGSQLVTRYQIDPYKERDTLNALSVFPDFLERILRLAASTLTEGEKIVIVCDALDEAGTFPDHFVFGLPKELPDGVYFILSQRPVNIKLPNYEPEIENIEAQGEKNLQDMESYLHLVAKRLEITRQILAKGYSEDFFAQTLKEKSLGVWMYLYYVIREIERGQRAPLDFEKLPTGLVGYYSEYWDNWRNGYRGIDSSKWDTLYGPLLTTLAAAQQAISVEKLLEWSGVQVNLSEVARLLSESWSAFISEKVEKGETVYTLYHQSLRDFIIGKVEIKKLPPTHANLVNDLSKKKVEADKRIVRAFEIECNGEWEKLVEKDYPRLHLTAHLNGAGEYEKLRIMLTEGDEKIKWAEAREKKEEAYSGFLNDLTYIWDYAEREQDYTLAVRCMLIENSIHSLASNITPILINGLAKTGLWSYARVLSTIRQKSKTSDQIESLRLLAPNIPKVFFHEALSLAFEIKSEPMRALALLEIIPYIDKEQIKQVYFLTSTFKNVAARVRVLSALAPYLDDQSISQVFADVYKIQDEVTCTRVLSAFAPYLSKELKPQALAVALGIKSKFLRVQALYFFIPYLFSEEKFQTLEEALFTISEIKDESIRASAISTLAQHLTSEQKPIVYSAICEINDASARFKALASLVPFINGSLKTKVLQDAIYTIRKIKKDFARARALSYIAPYLTEELKTQALSTSRKIRNCSARARALSALAPHLPDEIKTQAFNEVLSAIHEIKDGSTLADTASFITRHLNDDLKKQVTKEALFATFEIKDEYTRAKALSALAPYLKNEITTQAISAIYDFKDDFIRAQLMCDFVPHITNELKTQILTIARKIGNLLARTRALSNLAPHFEGELQIHVLQEALSAASDVQNEYAHARALSVLSPYITDELRKQSIYMASKFKDESARVDILTNLAPHLSKELVDQAFTTIYEMNNEIARVNALYSLIPYISKEKGFQAFVVSQGIKDEFTRARVLNFLARTLSSELRSQVLVVIREIKNASARAYALSVLAHLLPDETQPRVFQEALFSIHEIEDKSTRANVLSSILPYLSSSLKSQTLQEAISITFEIEDEMARIKPLSKLALHLNNELVVEMIKKIYEFKNESARSRALAAISQNLPEKLESWVLDATREIKNASARARALTVIVSHIPNEDRTQVFQEVLSAIYEIEDISTRTNALIAIAPQLSGRRKTQAFQEALIAAFDIKEVAAQAAALSTLVPYLNNELIIQALSNAHKIIDVSARTRVIADLIRHLNHESQVEILQRALYTTPGYLIDNILRVWRKNEFNGLKNLVIPYLKSVSQKSRNVGIEVLKSFTPALIHFSGAEIADELYRTITDVTRWWP